jgi:hypothetical protein
MDNLLLFRHILVVGEFSPNKEKKVYKITELAYGKTVV